ncbi:MAG TPA: cyclic nucleotide-binding domain-containing protein [Chthoniobacteraceae bacterium]|jgi:CRP-like cAMP-binding protein
MSTQSEIRQQLHGTALFAEFSTEELEQFLELCDLLNAAQDQVIVRQDESGDCMYIMASGSAKVVHHQGGRDIDLATLTSGDFFGELALVDEGPRSADVIALEDCVLLKITQAVISAVAGVYPTAAFKFLIAIGRIMVGRLRKSNQRYVDSLLFPIAGKD